MPSLVAFMLDQLNLTRQELVLEVGTGSGYQTAVLSHCCREVHTIEHKESLMQKAQEKLNALACNNVKFHTGDGALGYPDIIAKYDAIVVSAAVRSIPQSIVDQLSEGGRIIIPVGTDPEYQKLVLGIKENGKLIVQELTYVQFTQLRSKARGCWTEETVKTAIEAREKKLKEIAQAHGYRSVNDLLEKTLGRTPMGDADLCEIYLRLGLLEPLKLS